MRWILGLLAVLVLLGAVSGGVLAWRALNPKVTQPILFSHELHVKELDIGCDSCHTHYTTHASSGFPDIDICMACHDEQLGDSPEEAKLLEYVREGKQVPWKRIYVAADNVYYSHRRHVAIAKLACQECHGNIAGAATPPPRPLKPIKMAMCIGCHEKLGASVDCLGCHR